MGSTIRAESRQVVNPRLIIAVLAVVLSIAALSLSWPRFKASFRYLPVDIAIARFHADQQIPTDRLTVLLRYAGEAIEIQDHYRYQDGMSLLHYLRALDPYTPALERRPEYRASEARAVSSLSAAPAQPATWLRLASVRWILHDEPETIVRPWKMSIFTGRTHSSLFAHRVEMGLALRNHLDQEAIGMLRDQLLLAWRIHPGSLMGVLARRDRELLLTRELLVTTDPSALQEMEAWIGRLR